MSKVLNSSIFDPSQLTIKEKVHFFEKNAVIEKPTTRSNNFAASHGSVQRSISTSDNRSSHATTSLVTTSTPLSSQQPYTDSQSSGYRGNSVVFDRNKYSKSSSYNQLNQFPIKITDTISQIINDQNRSTVYYHAPEKQPSRSSGNMKEFNNAIKDLDSFLTKQLDEIETQKRLELTSKKQLLRENTDRNTRYNDQVLDTLQMLKSQINEIKINQKGIEDKIRMQEENQYSKLKSQFNVELANKLICQESSSSLYDSSIHNEFKCNERLTKKHSEDSQSIKKHYSNIQKETSQKVDSTISASSGLDERIRQLEAEIYKEETLMMKINRVLEKLTNINDQNLEDIVNIERHYLVASVRFQSALLELKKLNELGENPRLPPYNRKGKLIIRDIMLEIKPNYFQHPQRKPNDFFLALMKYDEKIYASKPVRIINDVRTIKFTEKFSIPEAYLDFNMRLEIYGTTFWKKHPNIRETLLKKYGFITFSLADTCNKRKRFQMIDVIQSENVPIRSKIMMRISQHITTEIKYKGNLFVKLRDVWHDAYGILNGHLLEIHFKKIYNTGITQSQETMLLDLYNVDSDAVIPIDAKRVSDKSFTFLLKFNHLVDFTNFYLMLAADSADSYFEWIEALNKILVLIK